MTKNKEIIPIFKTDGSIGKSILTGKHPDKVKEGGTNSVFKIAQDNKLDTICLIEDNFVSFYDAHNNAKKLGIKLVYGVYFILEDSENEKHFSKMAVLAKNDEGIKSLMQLFSAVNTRLNEKELKKGKKKGLPRLTTDKLKEFAKDNADDVKICVPFYDSFLHWNVENFDVFNIDLDDIDVTFFLDEKEHSFDDILRKKVVEYAKAHNKKTQEVHTVYYEKDNQVASLQVYKMVCNRTFGKKANLGNPNLEHFCSDKFSFESYLRKTNGN